MGRFDGQVAIVTGGALGIGGATARLLAKEGARVLIADIDDAAAAANVVRIRSAGGAADAVHADVGVSADDALMVETAVKKWRRLDILVQNAFGVATMGSSFQGSADTVSEEAWDRGIAVLQKAIFLGAKYAVPHMKKRGGGNIVNIGSVHSLRQTEGWLVYEAGKAAVIAMTRQMAVEYGPHGIRVNAICPGHIVTEALAKFWKDYPGGLEFFTQNYPLRRTGVPDDIAHAIAFLCSKEAGFITGHALVVDGGMTVQMPENLALRQAEALRKLPKLTLPDFAAGVTSPQAAGKPGRKRRGA
jgi:NAD(P)-dependent dehydrogenase (short-subunit alcohol dehydrogenase family)